MDIGIMIEGQNGLNWPRWQRIAHAVEDLGFPALHRSDHFTNLEPPDKDSLECWTSLTWLATNTKKLEFGPLVSPFSFRNPAMLARMAIAVDDLSGGRLALGVGGGWQEREHAVFGYDLLDLKSRFDRFAEGLEIVSRLLKSPEPVTFEGKYFQLQGATVLPRPSRPDGPRLIVGGSGEKRALPLVARYADEWNASFLTASELIRLNGVLDELLRLEGRSTSSIRRSMMTGLRFARTGQELDELLSRGSRTRDDLRQRGIVVGVGEEIKEQLVALEQTGLDRLMLQWLDLDNLDNLEAFAKVVL